MRTLLTLLLLSSVAFGAQIREQTYTPVGRSAIPQMIFVPLEPGPLPDDCLTNGAVFGIPVTVKLTNGLLSTPPLNGGRYDVDIGIYGKKFRVLIPPCDTNTYSLRDVVDYATNTSYSVIYQYLAPTNTFATKAELLSTSNVLYSSSGGTGGAATNVIWPVAGTNMSAVTNLLTVALSAEVSRSYVDSKASAATNEAQRVGAASTNLSYALGAAGTNEALRVSQNATQDVARASLDSTNFSLSIGAAATNEAARIGGLATNEALRVSQAATNEAVRLAGLNTNDTLRVSQNATSEVARAAAVMTNHVNMVSNAISGQIGGGVVNAAIQATNDSSGQSIATQFGNVTNHVLAVSNVLAQSTGGQTNTTVVAAGSNVTVTTNTSSGVSTYTVAAGASGGGGGESLDSIKTSRFVFEEFFGKVGSSPYGDLGFVAVANSGAIQQAAAIGDAHGKCRISTQASATSAPFISQLSDNYPVLLSAGVFTNEWRVLYNLLPDVGSNTNCYTNRIGLFNVASGAEPAAGVYFRFSTNSTALQCVTRNSNTETVSTCTNVIAVNTWYRLRIVVSGTTNAVFTVNDVDTVTHTNNLPTVATAATALMLKQVGTAASQLDVDYCSLGWRTFTTR